MTIQSNFHPSNASMGPPLDYAGTSHDTQRSNCSTCARRSAGTYPPTVETRSLTSPSEEKPVMKRAQVLLLAAILVAGSALLLRSAAAAGEEVDIIVNKANTIDGLSLADTKKVFMGD